MVRPNITFARIAIEIDSHIAWLFVKLNSAVRYSKMDLKIASYIFELS